MKPNNSCASACRYCKSYQPEGRRGGMCSQLGVLVKAHWASCSFATPAFHSEWQNLPEIVILEKSFSLTCTLPSVNLPSEFNTITVNKEAVSSD
ncbi:MAG: hypothetical protein GW856_07425 [Cyanobacteria bacterium]|jgi:hypothetical protein|nr:hypothetical protein [Cyanobacteria bacterium CG_2015-16_32_12]NCO78729.1 hypothetical protein [Cyanobacteria bacterium CG_2015-22_32_23]NCS83598.1 hypothetical protein [Cyanobacteria bacterium CG_2015-02_32_10]